MVQIDGRLVALGAIVLAGRRLPTRGFDAIWLALALLIAASVDSELLAQASGILAGGTAGVILERRRMLQLERETGRVTYRRVGFRPGRRDYLGPATRAPTLPASDS
jgi:hypothetical protein